MKNIRKQAELMGHTVVGKLKRLDNCVTRVKGQDREYREYKDDEGTIHNASSPYSEDSDHIMVYADTLNQCKAIIDARIRYSADIRRFSDIV